MADKSVTGAVGEQYTMRVEVGKVREFARAVMSSDPAYTEGDAPVAPPTFLVTAGAFWAPPGASVTAKAKLDLRRVLHAEQEFEFFGPPPRAGSMLTVQPRIAEIYEKKGRRGGTMTFVVVANEFRDSEGTLVAESRTTLVETGRPPVEEGSA